MDKRKLLPMGQEFYSEVANTFYIADKSLMIRDILDDTAKVFLFTRPRRFGKTLNMDMLRVFFEKTDRDTGIYFRDKKIYACGGEYTRHQGKYPVIWLTLKDTKYNDWDKALGAMGSLIAREFLRHRELEGQGSESERSFYDRIVNKKAGYDELTEAIGRLSWQLYEFYGVKPILLIDEYDAPLINAYAKDFCEEAAAFMQNMFSSTLKSNEYLTFAILTGVTRIARESLFSGLNNLAVYSVLEEKYSEYFGFTQSEMDDIVSVYGRKDRAGELAEWYNGYCFGGRNIYNPWSVTSYFAYGCKPGAYWVNTASNELIGQLMLDADPADRDTLQRLVNGEAVTAAVDTDTVFADITSEPGKVFGFLLTAGYLTGVSENSEWGAVCELSIPNREVNTAYRREVLKRFAPAMKIALAKEIADAVISCNAEVIAAGLSSLLMSSVSYYDTCRESYFHGLMLGLLVTMSDGYTVQSNAEAGDGRPDILMTPKRAGLPGVVIEIKSAPGLGGEELAELAEAALGQIEANRYAEPLIQSGAGSVIKYGAAFSGKNARVAVKHKEI